MSIDKALHIVRSTGYTIPAFIIGIVLAAGGSYVYAAWSGPTAPPPNDNVTPPINVSAVYQNKAGMLGVLGLAVYEAGLTVGTATLSDGSAQAGGAKLFVDVEGAVGAKKYCDEKGLNCKTIGEMGGGSVALSCRMGTCRATNPVSGYTTCNSNEVINGLHVNDTQEGLVSMRCCKIICE